MPYSLTEWIEQKGVDWATAMPSAVCDRQGQVLFAHSAPLSLCVGDSFLALLSAADRRFFAAEAEDAFYAIGRGKTVVTAWVGCLFGLPALRVILAPAISPAEALGAVRAGMFPGVRLSPGMIRFAEHAVLPRVGASACLHALVSAAAPDQPVTAESVARIFTLPPLCLYPVRVSLPEFFTSTFSDGRAALWQGMVYCLAAFLRRRQTVGEITVSAAGSGGRRTLLITGAAPSAVPKGIASLSVLAGHFPEADELALAEQFALRCGLTVDVFVTGDGRLGFAADAHPADPSQFGLKQPDAVLTCEEAEAKAEEWCRLLRAAVPECR
ncbi:MAG: hypothetical protein E7654_01870 [Ruminococcaceae bacterium]|nr:hypothetical protein [Oscillospiraceae bacterium]